MSKPSAAVRRLLEAPFDSFEKLEVGVALCKATAHTSSVPELSKALSMPRDLVERAIDELARAAAVNHAGGLVRLTLGADDGRALGELTQLYDDDRITVVRMMSEVAMDKIRGMAARTFADAFTLKKKKEDGDG